MKRLAFVFSALLASLSFNAFADQHRLIIQFKDDPNFPGFATKSYLQIQESVRNRVNALSRNSQRSMRLVRPFFKNGAIIQLDASPNDLAFALAEIKANPQVLSVSEDRRIRVSAQSPLVGLLNTITTGNRSRSWFHQSLSAQPASINTGAMWTNFHGTAPSVVAVLDTGVLTNHPMLQGHLLPGYDFVFDPATGNDNDGVSAINSRDADPSDPGDGGCGFSTSTWHGTFTSALVAGNPIPAEGILSVNWNANVLPVRVLGRCGGFSSDLADAIRWSAGLDVPGVPINPFPARVINLSLGAQGACNANIEGAAVSAARSAGALVVVAAGNDGAEVDSPGNCPGAFTVGAVDQEGLKASYSNFGGTVRMVAPGGDGAYPIWSASNTGTTNPLTNTYTTKTGTSFSAPMVAAAASLYLSLKPNATVSEVEAALLSATRPFLTKQNTQQCAPNLTFTTCVCNSASCGAGMLDVQRLISQVSAEGLTNLFSNEGNFIAPNTPYDFFTTGSTNSLGAEVSDISYSVFNVIKSSGSGDPFISGSGNQIQVTAPSGVSGFSLKATVAGGRSAVVNIEVGTPGSTSPTLIASLLSPLLDGSATAPDIAGGGGGSSNESATGPAGPSSGGSGGGGGALALSLPGLFAWLLLLIAFRKRELTSALRRS